MKIHPERLVHSVVGKKTKIGFNITEIPSKKKKTPPKGSVYLVRAIHDLPALCAVHLQSHPSIRSSRFFLLQG